MFIIYIACRDNFKKVLILNRAFINYVMINYDNKAIMNLKGYNKEVTGYENIRC